MPRLAVAPNVHIYYEDFGAGIPLVFTHAGSTSHAMWEHQVDGLAQDFRTVTWDWRGIGASDKPSSGYDVQTMVSDLGALVQGLELGRAVLVGHGFGSHVALIAAERFPERVAGLVLTSAAPWSGGNRDGVEGGLSPEYLEWLQGQMGSVGVSSPSAYAALFEQWLFKNPPTAVDLHAMVAGATQTPLYVMNRYRDSIAGVDHRERAGKIKVPTLILQGRHDRKQRYSGAVHLQTLIPGARLHTFEDSAHMPQVEQMQEYNRVLAGFAREVAGAR